MSIRQDIRLEKIPWPWATSTKEQDPFLALLCYGGVERGVGEGSSAHCFVTTTDPFVLQAKDLGKGQQHHSGQRRGREL